MELYLPPTYAKITRGCEYYETTETFKRRSAASKAKMAKYWSDKRHRRRIDKKQAKPVDVFDTDGHLVASFPSARKCAIAIFPELDYRSAERCVRACRIGAKRSFHGYRFKDHIEGRSFIGPMAKSVKTQGPRRCTTGHAWTCKGCTVTFHDGDTVSFDSLKACAEALGGTYSGIWYAMSQNRPYKGYKITINN